MAHALGTSRREIAYEVADVPAGGVTREELLIPDVPLSALPDLPFRVRPDYDHAYLTWLFARLDEAVPLRGPVVRRLVTASGSGRPAGWYGYRLAPSGTAEVLALVGRAGRVGRVLDHLLADAVHRGAAEVRGRLESGCADVLTRPGVTLTATGWPMVHSRDPPLPADLGARRPL